MIDLKALKEQLRLLGHDLPDSQVVAILKDMNIDFDDLAGEQSCSEIPNRRAEDKTLPAPPRTGSILDNFQDRQQQPSSSTQATASVLPAGSPQASQSFHYGYTSQDQGTALVYNNGGRSGGLGPNPSNGKAPDAVGTGSGDSDYEDDDDDFEEEPGVSCRYGDEKPGNPAAQPCARVGVSAYTRMGIHQAWSQPPSASGQGVGRSAHNGDVHGMGQPGRGSADLASSLGRMSLKEPTAAGASRPLRTDATHAGGKAAVKTSAARGVAAPRPSLAAHKQHPAGAATARDQHSKFPGRQSATVGRGHHHALLEEEESDVGLSDPDKDPLGLGGSLQDLGWMPPRRAWEGHGEPKAGSAAAPGRTNAPTSAAQGPYAAWLAGHHQPHDPYVVDGVVARGQLSPQASDRSFVSRATTRCSTTSKGGAKKVDRVQRYHQLQQEWSQNRFLKQASGTNRGSSRKPVNYHSHFASLHAAEDADRQRLLRETRARTKKELGAATEAPTANRRDELRWQTRMRLKVQT